MRYVERKDCAQTMSVSEVRPLILGDLFSCSSIIAQKKKVPANQFNQSTNVWGLSRFREHRKIMRIINTVTCPPVFMNEGVPCERGTPVKGEEENRAQTPRLLSSHALGSPWPEAQLVGKCEVLVLPPETFKSLKCIFKTRRVKREWSDTANQDHKESEVYYRHWNKPEKDHFAVWPKTEECLVGKRKQIGH